LRIVYGNAFSRPKDYTSVVSYPNQKGVFFRIRPPISSSRFLSEMREKISNFMIHAGKIEKNGSDPIPARLYREGNLIWILMIYPVSFLEEEGLC